MKFILLGFLLLLTACAQTPEESAAYREFGMKMLAQSQAQQQAQMQAMPMPRQTSCNTFGNQTSCTTY